MEKQLDLAREKTISAEAANSKASTRSGGGMARLQKDRDLSQYRTATAISAVTVLHKELGWVTAKVSNLEPKNAMHWKKIKKSS